MKWLVVHRVTRGRRGASAVAPDALWEIRCLPRVWLREQGGTPRIACRGVERNDRLSAGRARG